MHDDRNQRDWRNVNVKRNRKYEALVQKLCSRKNAYSNRPIFEFNKDLMVFASMVGYELGVKESLQADPIQITLGTYASDEKDGFIYLLALLVEKNVEILKDENLLEAVKIFEEFSNGGLSVIERWMEENPADIEGVDTLANKIFEQLLKCSAMKENNIVRKEVTF